MENIREKYKVELDSKKDKDKKKVEKTIYDVASYPFGAEEMLDLRDIEELDRDDR